MTENLKEKAMIFGNMNPPTLGHQRAVLDGLIPYANNLGIDHAIYTSKRHFKKPGIPHERTPLNPELKLSFLAKAFKTPNVRLHTTPFSAIQELLDSGYHRVHIMLGSDRVEDTGPKLVSAFGDRVKIVPFGAKREEGAAGLAGVSSTRLRKHAASGDFEAFKSIAPEMDPQDVEQLYHHVREGLKAARTPVLEEVSAQTRLKLARVAKRTARRRAMLRKARQRRRRNIKQLKKRAKQNVKGQLRHRYFGKGNWSKLSYSTRARIDQNVNKRKKIADTMIRRILPSVIKGESERLQRLTKKEDVEIHLDMLLEAVRGSRKVRSGRSGANSAKERAGARARKQKQRTNEKVAKQQGDIAGKYAVVTASSGKYAGRIMVVDKNSYNPAIHNIVVSPDKFSMSSGQKILDDDNFINTDSSIELYGKVEGEDTAKLGKRKGKAVEFSSGKKKKETEKKAQDKARKEFTENNKLPDIDLSIDENWTMPKTTKDRGFKPVDYEWAFVAIAEMLINGQDPKALIKDGSISEAQYMALADNKNLTQATLRALQNSGLMGAKKGKYKFIHSGRGLDQENSKLYKANQATDVTSKADVFVLDTENPENSFGFSFKSGAAQLGSSKEKETKAMFSYAYENTKNSLSKNCNKMINDIISDGFDQMSDSLKLPGGINAYKKNVGGLATRNPSVKKAVDESISQNKKLESTIGKIFEECKEFKKALLREAATGEGKFAGTSSKYIEDKYGVKANPGVATHILAISDDGTNASLVDLDDKFFDKLEPEVKVYVAAKTTDADTSARIKRYKDTKSKLLESANKDDFKTFSKIVEKDVYGGYEELGLKPPSFSKDELKKIMADIKESGSLPNAFKFKLMQAKAALRLGVSGHEGKNVDESIIYRFIKNYIKESTTLSIASDLDKNNGNNRSVYDELMELQDSDDLEEVDKEEWLQMAKEYVGDDLMRYLDFMGIELTGYSTNEIDFEQLFGTRYSPRVNTVYINGKTNYVPVMEKRDYRKEYDNYHSKPEQRKNRSKRVLARRLMMKLGRVKKGDGKDVDHKDGNPRNNGKSNLRVRSKSENRADND